MNKILKERWMKLAGVVNEQATNEAREDEVDFDIEARMKEPDVPMEIIDKLVQAKLKKFSDDIRWKIESVIEILQQESGDFEKNRDPYGIQSSNEFSGAVIDLEEVLSELEQLLDEEVSLKSTGTI